MQIKIRVNSQKPREKKQLSGVKCQDLKIFFTPKAVFFLLASFFFSLQTYPQCAMCRAALESEGDGVKAEAVNDGIVYLMVIPYLLVAIIGYAIYRMNKTK